MWIAAMVIGGAGVSPAAADVVPVGGPMEVAANPNPHYTWAAYNTSNGESLVFWNEYNSNDQYVRLLGADGKPKPGTSAVLITDSYFSPVNNDQGAVIYNPQRNNYMVLTSQRFQLPASQLRSEIQVQIVNADGTLGARTVVIDWADGGGQAPYRSDMAYDSVNNRFMVIAWGQVAVGPRAYRQVVINADGTPISTVFQGSAGYLANPQFQTDVHSLEFDPVSATYLYAHLEYSTDGDTAKVTSDNWIEAEQFSASGARLTERVVQPITTLGYTHVYLAPHPTSGQYMLSYVDHGTPDGGVTPRDTQYTQLLSADGSKVGARHLIGALPTHNGIEAGPVYDASTGGWVLFRGTQAPQQLDSSGRPICLPGESPINEIDVIATTPGRFLTVGRTSSSNNVYAQWYETKAPSTAAFVPAHAPFRVFDSRPAEPGPGPKGVVGPGSSVKVAVRGVGEIPDSTEVTAVVVNLTVIGSQPSFASAYPSGSIPSGSAPTFSNLNITQAGQVRPNMAIVPVGADGKIEVYAQGASDVIVDVTGWFEQAPCHASAGRFVPLPVSRVFDSRAGEAAPGPKGHIGAGQKVTVQIAGRGGVPTTGVSAVALAVVATNTDGAGFLTVAPTITGVPSTSLINVTAGETAPNGIITPLSPAGTVDVYVQSGADVAIDVSGYFTDGSAADTYAGLYVPIQPARLFDARPETTDPGPKGLTTNAAKTVIAAGVGGIPDTGVAAVALNIGALAQAAPGYVTAWNGTDARPVTSVLNFVANDVRSVAALTPLSANGRFNLYALTSAFLFADASGYFTK
jgi:hypothetical protein